MNDSQICSVSELKKAIADERTKVLDCSWYLPSQNRDTHTEFLQHHIVGSQFFHIDRICDSNTDLPHMLPTADEFASAVSTLGISDTDDVVVYDSAGLFSAARVWWMFRVFGHHSVRVLNGGLPEWIKAGGVLSNVPNVPPTGLFGAELNAELVASKALLVSNCESPIYTVLDARSTARFSGQAPEPRAGLPSGSMPNSVSLPFNELLENGGLKTVTQLRSLFSELGISESSEVVTSCGSGVTAAILTLALAECGFGLKRLYDGSWAEWGSADDTTIIDRSLA